jgi:SAM-dependent methyltransferase
MSEIDLMKNYPATDRSTLLDMREVVTNEDRIIAKKFGKDYFDGPRRLGLGGYYYDPKYFTNVVQDFINYYQLKPSAKILDVGCGKGFMMKDFKDALPNANIHGIDISEYCYENAMMDVKDRIKVGSCDDLPYPDDYFDLVVSIATIHNLDKEGVKRSLKEIVRVGTGKYYVKVNGYKTETEKINLERWNLVANTILPIREWQSLFKEVGYDGDYSFFST